MNYHQVWLQLTYQQDQTYFYLTLAAAAALMWYQFYFYRWFWPVCAVWGLVVGAALSWGFTFIEV